MHAADLEPVPASDRHQSGLDLFLIFAGANIVATTLQTGATLSTAYEPAVAFLLIASGCLIGSALVAVLAPLGPRLGVPSVIAIRDALGVRGAAAVALLLYITNFAWFAINNVIAASVIVRVFGVPGTERAWALALGVIATVVVVRGPNAVRQANRVAVPLMFLVGCGLTWALWYQPPAASAPASLPLPFSRGFDIVVAYQVSWLLMFADYSRYTASESKSAAAVYLALATTSLWFMVLGFVAARAAGSLDPGLMLDASGLGFLGVLLLTLATITTNFVNVYVSALAWKSLIPRAADRASVWSIGLIGTLVSLLSTTWLERYADFMLLLGSALVPVGGVLIAHYVILRRHPRIGDLYDVRGPLAQNRGVRLQGGVAWVAGTVTYFIAGRFGATLPALVVAIGTYLLLERWSRGGAVPLPFGRRTGGGRSGTAPQRERT